jgi:hypothetical protein
MSRNFKMSNLLDFFDPYLVEDGLASHLYGPEMFFIKPLGELPFD